MKPYQDLQVGASLPTTAADMSQIIPSNKITATSVQDHASKCCTLALFSVDYKDTPLLIMDLFSDFHRGAL